MLILKRSVNDEIFMLVPIVVSYMLIQISCLDCELDNNDNGMCKNSVLIISNNSIRILEKMRNLRIIQSRTLVRAGSTRESVHTINITRPKDDR